MAKTFITGDIVSADVSNSGEKRVAIASPMMLTTVDVEGVLQLSEKAKTIYDAFQSGCSVFVDTTGVTDNACVFICLSTADMGENASPRYVFFFMWGSDLIVFGAENGNEYPEISD